MGCIGSKDSSSPTEEKPQQFSWDREDRPDPKDFTIENQTGVTCGRKPGTVNGQQFIVDNCIDCNIYIFDHTAMVTVDNCKNCRVFIGPTKGSVFLRNCTNLQCVIVCQQFRLRDCRKIETYLSCATQPIIESSASIKFGCFQFFYPELEEQLAKSGLSAFNNTWYSIHDFTPVQDGDDNWSLIPETVSIEDLLPKPSSEAFESMEISYDKFKSSIPVTRGTKRRARFDDSCLIVFFHDNKSKCRQFLTQLQRSAEVDVIQSKEIKMSVDDAERIFKDAKYRDLSDKGALIGLELNGDDVIRTCEKGLSELGISLQDIFLSSSETQARLDIDAFYNYVDMTMS